MESKRCLNHGFQDEDGIEKSKVEGVIENKLHVSEPRWLGRSQYFREVKIVMDGRL